MNIFKRQKKKSNPETKFYKDSNKVSQIETVNDVGKYTVTKDHVTSLLRDNTNSLWSDNDQNLDHIDYLQMIELGVNNQDESLY